MLPKENPRLNCTIQPLQKISSAAGLQETPEVVCVKVGREFPLDVDDVEVARSPVPDDGLLEAACTIALQLYPQPSENLQFQSIARLLAPTKG